MWIHPQIANRLIAQHDTTGAAASHPEPSSASKGSSTSSYHASTSNNNNGSTVRAGPSVRPPPQLQSPSPPPPRGTAVRYRGGWDALRTIVRTEGVAGLYRGFGLSLLTYVPSGFVWWATYSASQRAFWK